jgi:hypothetical protein
MCPFRGIHIPLRVTAHLLDCETLGMEMFDYVENHSLHLRNLKITFINERKEKDIKIDF